MMRRQFYTFDSEVVGRYNTVAVKINTTGQTVEGQLFGLISWLRRTSHFNVQMGWTSVWK